MDEHKLVYTLSGFTRGVVQKDACVPGHNSVYPEGLIRGIFIRYFRDM